MEILPLENADLSLVELRDDGHIGRLTPHCKLHGAMNMVSADGYWRCSTRPTGIKQYNKKGVELEMPKWIENSCRAGCICMED